MSLPEEAAGVGWPLVGCQFWLGLPGSSDLVLFRPNFQWGPGAAKHGLSATDPCLLMVDAGREGCLEEAHCDTPRHRSYPPTPRTMQLPLLFCGLWALLAVQATATALTYKLNANEEACFYTATQNRDEKIAFYFAVCPPCPMAHSRQSDADFACRCNQAAPSTSISG